MMYSDYFVLSYSIEMIFPTNEVALAILNGLSTKIFSWTH